MASSRPSRLELTRARTQSYFDQARVREVLHDLTVEIALHQPEDPRRFIYEKLGAEYAMEPPDEKGANSNVLDRSDCLRVQAECRIGGIARHTTFVRRAPTDPPLAKMQYFDWKTDALAQLAAFVDEAAGLDTPPGYIQIEGPSKLREHPIGGTAVAEPAGEDKPAVPQVSPQTPAVKSMTEMEKFGAAQPSVHLEYTKEHMGSAEEKQPVREAWVAWRSAAIGGLLEAVAEETIDRIVLGWSTLRLNGQSLKDIIKDADTDSSGDISRPEFAAALEAFEFPTDVIHDEAQLEQVFLRLSNSDDRISIKDLQTAVDLSLVRHNLADWIDTLRLSHVIAAHLLPSNLACTLHYHEPAVELMHLEMAPLLARIEGVEAHVKRHICRALDVLEKEKLSEQSELDLGIGHSSKFAWDADGKGIAALFADISFFRKGLNELIGLPDSDIRKGMRDEHCSGDLCQVSFETSNYGTETTPAKEWQFVEDPLDEMYVGEATEDNTHGRVRRQIQDLMRICPAKGLTPLLSEEELIALRLYTGPQNCTYIHAETN